MKAKFKDKKIIDSNITIKFTSLKIILYAYGLDFWRTLSTTQCIKILICGLVKNNIALVDGELTTQRIRVRHLQLDKSLKFLP